MSNIFPWVSHGFPMVFPWVSIAFWIRRISPWFFQGQRRFPVDHHRPQEPHLGSQRARRKDGPSSNGHRELQTAGCWGNDCSCEVKVSVCYAVKYQLYSCCVWDGKKSVACTCFHTHTPHTTHHTPHTTHHTPHTTHHTPHTTHHTPHTTHHTPHTTHHTPHTTHNTQHTTHNTQHTTHNTQHTTHNTQHTTHNTQHTTHNTQHTPHTHTHKLNSVDCWTSQVNQSVQTYTVSWQRHSVYFHVLLTKWNLPTSRYECAKIAKWLLNMKKKKENPNKAPLHPFFRW